MPAPGSVLLLLVPLVVWRMYARVRRLVGRQRLSRVRPWITLTVFPTLLLLVGYLARSQTAALAWLAAGVAAGAALGVFGLKRTRFEPTPKGLFYTPNVHLGIALSLLFFGRIAYRLFQVYAMRSAQVNDLSGFAVSRLTVAIFGLLAGYYVSYAIGLARWRAGVMRRKREREAKTRVG